MIRLSKDSDWNHHVVLVNCSRNALDIGVTPGTRSSFGVRDPESGKIASASSNQMPAEKFRGFRPRQGRCVRPVIV